VRSRDVARERVHALDGRCLHEARKRNLRAWRAGIRQHIVRLTQVVLAPVRTRVHKVQDLDRGARIEWQFRVRHGHERLAEAVRTRVRGVVRERREAAHVAAGARHVPGAVERAPALELALPRRAVAARHAPGGHGALLRGRLVQLHGYLDRRRAVELAKRERRVDGVRARELHGRLEGVCLGLLGRREECARDTRNPRAPERRLAEVDADNADLRVRVRESLAQRVRAMRGHLGMCTRHKVHNARPCGGRLTMSLGEQAIKRGREGLERCVSTSTYGRSRRASTRAAARAAHAWSRAWGARAATARVHRPHRTRRR